MLFAIDWDGTVTADYTLFATFLREITRVGHHYLIVTGRKDAEPVDYHKIPGYKLYPALDIIYADNEYKCTVVERFGYNVDIWIDNEPGTIEPGKKLEW